MNDHSEILRLNEFLDEIRRTHRRWIYILERTDDMKTSQYKSLCALLGIEYEVEYFDFAKAIDDAIAAEKGKNL